MHAEGEAILGFKEIAAILPHRYPFLLIDRVLHLDLDNNTIVAQKNLTINELFFQGHFPGSPIMPGVLVVEALAQAGGILAYEKGYKDRIAVLLNMNNVKFRKPVYPGDTLYLCVEGCHFSSKAVRVKGEAYINSRDGKPAVQAEITCALVDRRQI